MSSNITAPNIQRNVSACQAPRTTGCHRCGRPLATPYVVLPTGGAVHLRCIAGLGAVDDVCVGLAVHTDQLASLAHERDDAALVRAALEAERLCSTLHTAYTTFATAGYEVEP